MNCVQLLNKLKLYQFKVFFDRWLRLEGSVQYKMAMRKLRKNGYLFDWQYNFLNKQWKNKRATN